MIRRLLAYLFIIIFINATFSACSDDDDEEEATTSAFDTHAVDLGLPSGVLWSDVNLGANAPEDYGDFFAWGEVETKSSYSWESYKYGDENALTKYVLKAHAYKSGKDGFADDKAQLDRADDAAAAKWGGAWRTPTIEEVEELSDNATWTWTERNGVKGYKIVGPNGNSIFLPASGFRNADNIDNLDTSGTYWTSSINPDDSNYAKSLNFSNFLHYTNSYRFGRYSGRNIRPVKY